MHVFTQLVSGKGENGGVKAATLKCIMTTSKAVDTTLERLSTLGVVNSDKIRVYSMTNELNVEHGFGIICTYGGQYSKTQLEYLTTKRKSELDFIFK